MQVHMSKSFSFFMYTELGSKTEKSFLDFFFVSRTRMWNTILWEAEEASCT